jgi:four helix bundle protein
MFQAEELKKRTKSFAIRIVKLFRSLPRTEERVVGRQLLRSGTSVAANYRAVCRARSKAEFIAKIGEVVEETDATVLWLELFVDVEIVAPKRMTSLLAEANELLAIFAASQHTARKKRVH